MKAASKFALLLFAISCSAAMLAPTAFAKQQFHAETEDTTITGSTVAKHTFKFGSVGVICNSSKVEGTMTGTTSSELTLTPTYENCFLEPFEKTPVGVNMSGCDYLVTLREEAPTIQTHVKCPAGAGIRVTTPSCEFEIGPQTLSGYKFKNTGEGMSRDFDMIEEGVGFGFTVVAGTCEGGTGSLSGETTIRGEGPKGESMGVWVE